MNNYENQVNKNSMIGTSGSSSSSSSSSSSNGSSSVNRNKKSTRSKSEASNETNFLFILLVGVLLRILLVNNTSLREWLTNRVEISTPLTSWNRVLEGIYLKQTVGLNSSYESDLVHEIPLMLGFYQVMLNTYGEQTSSDKTTFITSYVFIAVDLLSAILLYSLTRKLIEHTQHVESVDYESGKYKRLVDSFADDSERDSQLHKFLVCGNRAMDPKFWSLVTLAVFFFNPFGIASCLALSTVVFHNLILLLWLYFLATEQTLLSFLSLALHSNITVYSLVLIIPSISFLIQKKTYSGSQPSIAMSIVRHTLMFVALIGAIFAANLFMETFNMRFISNTYLFILAVPDLLPNLGLFWYFFVEMFDHFRLFFTYVFQINVFIFTIPLTMRLRNDPIVNIFLQLGIIASLKSYPSIGETGLYISFLPMFAYLFPHMRNLFVYSCMLVISIVLAPIMFYLWLGSGGGNANFYFAITLVYTVGQIFLLVDIFYATLRREFIKINGSNIPKTKSGSPAIFSLE